MDVKEPMIKINLTTILAALSLLAGILFYVGWGVTYGVWADIGIYSVTIVLVLGGVLGLLLTVFEEKTET